MHFWQTPPDLMRRMYEGMNVSFRGPINWVVFDRMASNRRGAGELRRRPLDRRRITLRFNP